MLGGYGVDFGCHGRAAEKKVKKFVTGLSAPHKLLWIEERGAETNGHDDPSQRSTSFIKVLSELTLNDPERKPRVSFICKS